MANIRNFHIFALAAHGEGISGGDRIFIELARRWQSEFPITIHTWEEGKRMCDRQGLSESKNLKYKTHKLGVFSKLGFVLGYMARILIGTKLGLTLRLENKKQVYLYNASEFWMDSLPCFILKLRYSEIKWIATWYQTAPNPLKGFAEGKRKERYRLNALLYWLAQLPIKPLIANFADFVLVNNQSERSQFPGLNKKDRAVVVIGAVPLENINKYRSLITDRRSLKYDAVFQGRFHAQKGVIELIEIWKKVVEKKPYAKLAMIGDGPLMRNVRLKIKSLKLENNVKLFGYVFDGDKKYKIFSESKVVVHPAFYDSGGMASAEAMAFGIPAVGFNLESYKSYYPRGMIKVKIGDLHAFSRAILDLLEDDAKRRRLGNDAKALIEKSWSWDRRADEILMKIR